MKNRRKLLMGAIALSVAAFCATMTFVLLPQHWFDEPVGEPTTEEYAVYSGFLDTFFDSQFFYGPKIEDPSKALIYVAAETLPSRDPGSILPLQVVALGTEQMGREFYRQNARSWKLQPRIHSRFEVRVASEKLLRPHAPTQEYFSENHQTCAISEDYRSHGALHLSRVGFSRDHKLAILQYDYVCSIVGSQSGWILLEKNGDSWKVKTESGGPIS